MDVDDDIDVQALLPQIRVPTLVIHCDDDHVVAPERGRSLAAAIPGARYVSLPSANHLLLEDEPAGRVSWRSLDCFSDGTRSRAVGEGRL
jgi:pimeloyl-ACP methyl ester carboxylesterase